MRLKLYDYLVLIFTLSIIGVFVFSAYGNQRDAREVIITAPDQSWVFPVSEDNHVHIDGELGTMEIEIADGKVRVISSPCREKICIQTGRISKAGSWIACIPNRVFIQIKGKDESETDATSF